MLLGQRRRQVASSGIRTANARKKTRRKTLAPTTGTDHLAQRARPIRRRKHPADASIEAKRQSSFDESHLR